MNIHKTGSFRELEASLLALHHECFYEAYGEPIAPYLGNVVVIFRGMVREYLSHAVQAVIAVSMAELTEFIVDRLDTLILNLVACQAKPILEAKNAFFNDINQTN
ncbi:MULTISPECIES: hypothetical protein [Paenibacillus]|uniref:Uncharacterized protein n=1 Tax=Paenibacillus lautus TaxID=1401 RepID=A0A1R1B1D9_PAELA|nr:hypothetical protein [Paenibacillus lautus]OME92320.1 hypothetical protein BK123_17115 [Paenibacillus lautus]